MATHSVSLAPDAVQFWDDQDDLPMSDYCAAPLCCPSDLCDACFVALHPECDCCRHGIAVAVLRPEGLPALSVCLDCALVDAAEKAVGR